MISLVKNNQIIEYPKIVPKNWKDPYTQILYINFHNFDLEDIYSFGWKEVIDDIPEINEIYEQLNLSEWYYDEINDVVTRDYTIVDKNIDTVKNERLETVRTECREKILAVINYPHQIDVALGIIPDLGYTTWIASMITESNRCEDLYTNATTIQEIKDVVWNFPEYSYEV